MLDKLVTATREGSSLGRDLMREGVNPGFARNLQIDELESSNIDASARTTRSEAGGNSGGKAWGPGVKLQLEGVAGGPSEPAHESAENQIGSVNISSNPTIMPIGTVSHHAASAV